MLEMTLTAKNQFTLNKPLLAHLGLKAGDKIAVRKLPDGSLNIAASRQQRDITELAGALKGKTDVTLSIEEINQIIAHGYNEHGRQPGVSA